VRRHSESENASRRCVIGLQVGTNQLAEFSLMRDRYTQLKVVAAMVQRHIVHQYISVNVVEPTSRACHRLKNVHHFVRHPKGKSP